MCDVLRDWLVTHCSLLLCIYKRLSLWNEAFAIWTLKPGDPPAKKSPFFSTIALKLTGGRLVYMDTLVYLKYKTYKLYGHTGLFKI